MIDIDNQSDLSIPSKTIEEITQTLTEKDIELLVIDNQQIQAINKEHRNIDKATDVLSFPFEDIPMAPLGSIVISSDYVKASSEKFGHSKENEFCLLYIHGLLHLMGYDHENDEGEMREMEKEIIQRFGLPQSLIIRTQEN